MLISLHVKNLALIEETEVYFKKGLNILTGETGAGKSIVIGSVNLALGAKAEKELIRTGQEYAYVELVFAADGAWQKNRLEKMGIVPEEDGTIILSRRIMPTRSVCKINGETVTARQMKELAELLIDIHGQHEHQSLLYQKKHFEILDAFCGEELSRIKEALSGKYHDCKELSRKLEEVREKEKDREKEISLAEFEWKEIEDAALQKGEDEELEQSYRKMTNSRKLMEAVSAAYSMTRTENGSGASEEIGRALRELLGVSGYDRQLDDLAGQLEEIDNLLNDFNRSLAGYLTGLEYDEKDFLQTEERLNLLNHLKAKYGESLEAVLSYQEELKERIAHLNHLEEYKDSLEKEKKASEEELLSLCKKASGIRQKNAALLEEKMKEALLDLNFLTVAFAIKVEQNPEAVTPKGYDMVEFLISTNPGEPVKPLGSVASGGELSRIMLAIKTVLAQEDEIDTLIFDEIDAGISGKTAWQVSKKLALLGREHQVICITHLPQIAAMADSHFKIEKKVSNHATTTQIWEIAGEESVMELARLLGGDAPTEAALENAREMKELAANTKQY